MPKRKQPADNRTGKRPGNEHSANKDLEKKTPPSALLKEARLEAEHDIEADPEFSAHSPNDDLDEGETARLGEDKTDLV